MHESGHGHGNPQVEGFGRLITKVLQSYMSVMGLEGSMPTVVVDLAPEQDALCATAQLPGQVTVLSLAGKLAASGAGPGMGWMYKSAQLEDDPQWVAKGPDAERLIDTFSITGFGSISSLCVYRPENRIDIMQGEQSWELLGRWITHDEDAAP